jgi:hypothetical protein
MNSKYLDRREAAEYVSSKGLKTSWRTLQKMATTGGGPIYRIFGMRSVYLQSDLDQWVDEKLSTPRRNTSEAAAASATVAA